MQEAHPVEAVQLEQEEPRRGRRGVLEASGGEVGGVEPERRRDGAELEQPVLEEVPRHEHGGPPRPRQHPEDDVAPPPVRAHVPLDDAEAEEEDDPAEVAAEARLVGAADGDHGGVQGGVGVADLHHLVAGHPHPVLRLRSPATGRGGAAIFTERGCRGCGDRQTAEADAEAAEETREMWTESWAILLFLAVAEGEKGNQQISEVAREGDLCVDKSTSHSAGQDWLDGEIFFCFVLLCTPLCSVRLSRSGLSPCPRFFLT